MGSICEKEALLDDKVKLTLIQIIASLQDNWCKFLDQANASAIDFKDKISKLKKEKKNLRKELEFEKEFYKDRLERQKMIYEKGELVVKLKRIKNEFEELQVDSEARKKELTSEINLLKLRAKELKERLKPFEQDNKLLQLAGEVKREKAYARNLEEKFEKELKQKESQIYRLQIDKGSFRVKVCCIFYINNILCRMKK